MVCNGIIQNFIVNVNPALFGYEKECLLTVKHSYKKTITSEDEIIKQLNLLGDVRVYAKQLQRSALFAILLRPAGKYNIIAAFPDGTYKTISNFEVQSGVAQTLDFAY